LIFCFQLSWGGRELPFEFSLLKKPVFFLVVEISRSIGMLDQIIVGVGGKVCLNPLQAFKNISGVDTDKAIDSDAPNVSCRSVEPVPDIAMLKNVLTAWTLIKFLADFDPDQVPFETCRFEHLRGRQREDMRFQPFEVVAFHSDQPL
jgi:hypothetical protein